MEGFWVPLGWPFRPECQFYAILSTAPWRPRRILQTLCLAMFNFYKVLTNFTKHRQALQKTRDTGFPLF